MGSKFKVFLIAYRDVAPQVEKILLNSSVRVIDEVRDLEMTEGFCSKGFNLNSRLCIYVDWFKDQAVEKLREGYKLAILEVPGSVGASKSDLLSTLDIGYEEEILVLESVDV